MAASEPKRRAAPPPPSAIQIKDDVEKGSKESEEVASQSPSKPEPYNPFDEDEEQESDENTLKPGHPWYGITPTSSPKAQKRPAPKAPNASPLGKNVPVGTRLRFIYTIYVYVLFNGLMRNTKSCKLYHMHLSL